MATVQDVSKVEVRWGAAWEDIFPLLSGQAWDEIDELLHMPPC